MNLKTITTFINAQNHTTSTLYGNKEAYESLLNSDSVNNKKILVLITWKQQDEPKWFGAKIPGSLISIETLKTDTNFKDKRNISYGLLPGGNSHDGKPDQADKRINDILALQPAVMP